jgi:aspartate aminotransferase
VFGDTLTRPEGAFYVFPNLAGLVPEPVGGERVSDVIVQRFLDHGIAVVPGTAFGDESYARHVRISFSGVSDAVLTAGLDRMLTGVLMQEDRIAG